MQWAPGSLQPYGPLQVSPAAGVLNYGQGIFEGMKAYRTVAGRVVLFRPDQVRPPSHQVSVAASLTRCMRNSLSERCPLRGRRSSDEHAARPQG